MMGNKFSDYAALIRFDKPIGTLLVLWPTLWGLWLASSGAVRFDYFFIFTLGCFLMRSAGCAINDYADRDFDKHVQRTQDRPVTAGRVKPFEALIVTAILAVASFILIWPLNAYAKWISVPALLVAIIYPFTKRFFSIPQAILGIAFSFGIPMSYAAVTNHIPWEAWILVLANVAWAIAYDTAYAMVDREDDMKIGIKTSAITFGQYDLKIIMICYSIMMLCFAWLGVTKAANFSYWLLYVVAIILVIYYYQLMRARERTSCFLAFRRNNWLGACLFFAIAAGF